LPDANGSGFIAQWENFFNLVLVCFNFVNFVKTQSMYNNLENIHRMLLLTRYWREITKGHKVFESTAPKKLKLTKAHCIVIELLQWQSS